MSGNSTSKDSYVEPYLINDFTMEKKQFIATQSTLSFLWKKKQQKQREYMAYGSNS